MKTKYFKKLTRKEVKYKYTTYPKASITFANPSDYDGSRLNRKTYIEINHKLDQLYFNL